MSNTTNKYTELTNWLHYLTVKNVAEIAHHKPKLITLTSNASIKDALKVLDDNQISSCPLKDKEDTEYIGFVDDLDILTYILRCFSEDKNMESMQWSSWCQNIDELKVKERELGNVSVKEALNISAIDSWCPVYNSGSLFQLCEVFARGIHRVPVWRDEGHAVETIVTQSDVVNLITQAMENDKDNKLFGDLHNKTLKELNIGFKDNIISMSSKAQAIHAFWLMFYHKVTGVAVIDKDGRLIGNLSASDIKGIGSFLKLSSLLLPIREFFYARHHTRRLQHPVVVTPSTTFSFLLEKITMFRTHRVWIVDENMKPVGLITLSDILRFLVELDNQKQ